MFYVSAGKYYYFLNTIFKKLKSNFSKYRVKNRNLTDSQQYPYKLYICVYYLENWLFYIVVSLQNEFAHFYKIRNRI